MSILGLNSNILTTWDYRQMVLADMLSPESTLQTSRIPFASGWQLRHTMRL